MLENPQEYLALTIFLWMSEENRQLNSDIIIERQQLTFEVIHNMKGEDVCQTIEEKKMRLSDR